MRGVKREGIIKEEDRIDNKLVEECLGRAKDIVIMITGGYHSEGMSKILEGSGISNIVITPNVIGDIDRAEKIYGGIIKDEVKILKEALNYTIMSQMPKMERLKYFVNAGIEIIKDVGYSREIIRQMVIAINESFGEGTAEVAKLEDNEGMIRFAKGELIRIQRGDKGVLVIKEEGDILGRQEEGTKKAKKVEELGRFINVIKEEVLGGKILEVREQVKRFYKIAYERGVNGVLSTDGLIYELDEYRRREGVREIEGVSIEVISKMPRGVQEYLFARVLGREVEISRLGEKTRAVVTAIVEIGHIFMASEDRGYFEKFLGMHGKENEVRQAGLLAITEAVREALNDMGKSLADRYTKAIEVGFNKHVEHNIAHPEAKLEWKLLLFVPISIIGISLLLKRLFRYTQKVNVKADKDNKGTISISDMESKTLDTLSSERLQILKSPPLLNSSEKEELEAYRSDLDIYESLIAEKVDSSTSTSTLNQSEHIYFKIFAKKKNVSFLQDIVSSTAVTHTSSTYTIAHKLYAYMFLRALGKDVDHDAKERLFLDSLNSIRKKEFIISDDGSVNFNLRALITGIDLILTSILGKTIEGLLLEDNKMKNLRGKIPKALFLGTDGINPGFSDLIFAKILLKTFPTLCECISHELGHNYLEALGLGLKDSFINSTYHEFFAFTIQGFFNDAITHGMVTRSVRKVFSVLSLNPFSIPRLLLLPLFPSLRSNKGIYNQLVWLESINTPPISIAAVSMPILFITSLSKCLHISVIGYFIPIGYIMRRFLSTIRFGREGLAHVDALSLLRAVEIADYKEFNFLVTAKLAIEFFKTRVYSDKDPEYKMVDKFIEFTLKNSKKIHNEILKNSFSDFLNDLKGNKVLTKSDVQGLFKGTYSSQSDSSSSSSSSDSTTSPVPDATSLELPILRGIYNFLGISSKSKRAKITAVLEAPLIMLASIFPSFGEIFLSWHGKGGKEERTRGLGQIRQAVRAAWGVTYSRIPGVNLCLRIYEVIKVNYIKHVEWNIRQEEERKVELGDEEGAAGVLIEYHEVSKGELEGEVREFGVEARVGVNGDISMPVYVIREKLAEGEGEAYNFENSGVSIGGETLWIGGYKRGVVVYAEGRGMGDIVREMGSSKKVKGIIKGKVESSIKGIEVKDIEIEGIVEIGDREEVEGEGISYTDNGNIKVGYKLFKEKVEKGEVLEFSGTLRAIKKAEGYTYARSIIHNLDDVEDVEGFKEYLRQHQKIGNGQIVVKESLVKKMVEEIKDVRVMEFLSEARKDGVEVYVMLAEREERKEGVKEYERMGFAGYVEGKELSNFALGSRIEMEDIGRFRNERELEESLREAKGLVLIDNTELKEVIEESRTGLSIGELIGVLSNIKKVISIFKNRGISKEHVEGVVRNIEIKDIGEINEEIMGGIKEMVRNKGFRIDNLKKILKLSEKGSDVISVYISKVEKQVEGREDKEEIMEVVVKGIIERVLVAEVLRRKNKELGLMDKNHEIMLGKALMASLERGIEYEKGDKREVEEFVEGLNTELEVEVKLNKELPELVVMGIEGNEEGALRKIIELIPEISEGRRKLELSEDMRPKIDIRSYSSILSAA